MGIHITLKGLVTMNNNQGDISREVVMTSLHRYGLPAEELDKFAEILSDVQKDATTPRILQARWGIKELLLYNFWPLDSASRSHTVLPTFFESGVCKGCNLVVDIDKAVGTRGDVFDGICARNKHNRTSSICS